MTWYFFYCGNGECYIFIDLFIVPRTLWFIHSFDMIRSELLYILLKGIAIKKRALRGSGWMFHGKVTVWFTSSIIVESGNEICILIYNPWFSTFLRCRQFNKMLHMKGICLEWKRWIKNKFGLEFRTISDGKLLRCR